MKAILREDMITQLSLDKGIEVGNMPSGVSIDRVRWDGVRLVDLLKVRHIYVRVLEHNYFELHIMPLKNTHEVQMTYKDRKRLRVGSEGKPYLADDTFIEQEVKDEKIKAADLKLFEKLGGSQKQFQGLQALLMAVIVYASTGSTTLKTLFDDLTPHIRDAYPLARYEEILKAAAKHLKNCMEEYHSEIDRINTTTEPEGNDD